MTTHPKDSTLPLPHVGHVYEYDDGSSPPVLVTFVNPKVDEVHYKTLGALQGEALPSSFPQSFRYLRPGTPEECKAAGIEPPLTRVMPPLAPSAPPVDPTLFHGVAVIPSGYLTPRTMIVSEDMYELIVRAFTIPAPALAAQGAPSTKDQQVAGDSPSGR